MAEQGRKLIYDTPLGVGDPQICYMADHNGIRNVYMTPVTSPQDATFNTDFTLITDQITTHQDTFIALRSLVAGTFAQEILFKIDSGEWTQGEVITSQFAILPVTFSQIGTYNITVTDGVNTSTFTVTATITAATIGSFGIISSYYDVGFAGVSRTVVVYGMGMGNVTRVELLGVADLTYTLIQDSVLIINATGLVVGANTIRMYDSTGATLGDIVITPTVTSQKDIEVFYHTTSLITTVWVKTDIYFDDIYFFDGAITRRYDHRILDMYQSDNLTKDTFILIVRDKSGAIMPLATYTITGKASTGTNFSLTGNSNRNGVVQISLSALPDYFTITFASYELAYLNRSYSKQP